MQAIILAAGMGTRLGPKTKEIAKCMVEINDEPLIKRQIEYLNRVGMKRIVIVCGYNKDKLIKYVKKQFSDLDIIFVENDDYMKSNNIVSLYLAKDYLKEDDTILLDSDLIFEYKIIDDIVNDKRKNIIAVDKFQNQMNGTVVKSDENNVICEICNSKELDMNEMKEIYKTINIYKMGKDFINTKYVPMLEKYISLNKINEYYETVFKDIVKQKQTNLYTMVFEKEKWYEVDTIQDLEIAESIFSEDSENIIQYNQRYGGYWRFKNLKDFCYLVNPMFPTKNMLARMNYSFDGLTTQYPSTLKVINSAAASYFDIGKEKIIVGNGASELMKALGRITTGKISLQVPIFNEYVEDFKNCVITKKYTFSKDYKYNKSDIIEEVYNSDNIVIVNPDNPSGNFIEYNDMKEILKFSKENNKTVIFDESYIDFVDKEKRYTLINDETLEEYPNLIVIKSLGKSYGIAGIRLGILATGNEGIIEKLKQELNVWNINSFAEYFIQTIGLYKDEYEESCTYIENQRNKMIDELSKLKYLKVYNSQANFLMCEVNGDSKELTKYLLKEHDIYIKDLTNKEGMNSEKNYIRMAIKKEEENNQLIQALKNYELREGKKE